MTSAQTINNAASQSLLDSVNGARKTATASINEVQDRFMTLLVTQMRNQDPLNPMDNAQVTSQMAQLSTVSGINKLNATVESLINSVQAGQAYQASGMIGHHVMVAGNQISTSGEGGFLGAELPVGADKLIVNIKGSNGEIIRTMEHGAKSAGTFPLTWDGRDQNGVLVSNGTYQFQLEATVGGKAVDANSLSYAQVMSVSNNGSGIQLNLSNNSSVSTSDVKEIF